MKKSNELEIRFKVAALLVMSDEKYKILDDKLPVIANAIDMGYPKSKDLVYLLEDHCIKINEYFLAINNSGQN